MTAQPYNFRRPGRLPPETEGRLGAWLRAAAGLAMTRWARQAPFPLEVRLRRADTVYAKDALAALGETALGYQVPGPPGTWTSLAAFSRPLVLALEAALMGETPTQLPADRDLTAVEESLCEYLLQELLVRPLQETWPEPEGLALQLGGKEPNPRWSRLYPPGAVLVECSFAVKGPFGEDGWTWLLPQSAVLPEGAGAALGPGLDEATRKARLEGLVLEMPVEIAVTLGTVQVPLTELARLQAGDVLVLDQRVGDPLPASVAGGPRLLGWPGRVGPAQALQVESFSER